MTASASINHITLNENDIGPYRTYLKLSPLEYWKRNCFSAIESGETEVGSVVELLGGADNICVSSDSKTAWIALQENNALAVLDIEAVAAEGSMRHTLDGTPVEPVSDPHRARARRVLEVDAEPRSEK